MRPVKIVGSFIKVNVINQKNLEKAKDNDGSLIISTNHHRNLKNDPYIEIQSTISPAWSL
jgi:hypothetical protein